MLHWDSLCARRKKFKAVLMYKSLHGQAPSYLQNLATRIIICAILIKNYHFPDFE